MIRPATTNKRGVALVLTLSILVLITVLVVGLSSILTTERSTARKGLDSQGAKLMAEMARDHAIALLRDGIEGGRAQGKMWASQPGRITIFKSDGTVDTTLSRDLSSGTGGADQIDLNQAPFSGNNPIASATSIGAGSAPAMPVNWINVPGDPLSNFGAANPVVGRYAFWVDDESSKINVNTADGTSKYTDPSYTAAQSAVPVSYGDGMPTEVSLGALTNSVTAAGILPAVAKSIASVTGVRPGSGVSRFFSSPSEILQPTGVPGNAYQDNNFNLTHYSRSPELNIFGEPKIYLMTAANTSATETPQNLSIGQYEVAGNNNYPSGLPIKQVYPSSNALTINYPESPQAYIGNDILQTGVGNQLPPFLHAPPFNMFFDTFVGSPENIALPQYFAYYCFNTRCLTGGAVGNFPDTYWDGQVAGRFFYNNVLGMRIAQYLKGYNSSGVPITWPPFLGTQPDTHGLTGFAGKYTDRQIDSITMQLMDMMCKDKDVDVHGAVSVPTVQPHGFLSPLPIKGVGRFPCLNQVAMTFVVTPGNPPRISITTDIQWWAPKGFKGTPMDDRAYDYILSNNGDGWMNLQDCPGYSYLTGAVTAPSPLGGLEPFWHCQMFNIKGQDGYDAGVDLWGNTSAFPDPDPVAANKFHANLHGVGGGPVPSGLFQFFPALVAFPTSPVVLQDWTSGDFRCTESGTGNVLYQMRYDQSGDPSPPSDALPALTNITIGGGITLWGGNNGAFNPFPLDSFRGPNTGESLSDPQVRAAVLAAVIPMPGLPNRPPLTLSCTDARYLVGKILLKVADPMVDNMPGDWIAEAANDTVSLANLAPDVTLIPKDSPEFYAAQTYGATRYFASEYPNGANVEFQAKGGGDPNSYWLPEVNQNIPKSQRFPSVGYMQYIRTGIMPDKEDDISGDPTDPTYIDPTTVGYVQKYQAQHGTPFRLLSLAPSYDPSALPAIAANPGQKTAGGGSYPDWAMLDLFTSPVSPQPLPPATPPGGPTPAMPPYLEMTYGGSTPGRVNINSPAGLAPFDATVLRLLPLEAVFKDVQASNSYSSPPMVNGLEDPIMTTVDEKALAGAISTYLSTLKDSNGVSRPFMMPSEIANVPAVANYVYDGTHNSPSTTHLPRAALSRNDLLRQTLGSLTTQSNTFSVWAVGQSIRKRPGNTDYANVQTSDFVLGETRMHYIVERYIDLGTDGVPGNAITGGSGADGIVGTPDDLIDGDDTPGHIVAGANPKMTYPLPYKYRVIASEEIAN